MEHTSVKYKALRRFGFGVGIAAVSMLIFSAGNKVQAATIGTNTGVAGISLSLDTYYEIMKSREVSKTRSADTEEPVTAMAVPVSEYENVGISVANPYVNIRTEPNTDSEVVGKLYKGSAATIVETVGDWVKITSGNAKGYIKSEYLAIGFDAEELVDKYATRWATPNTYTLNARMDPTEDSKIATQVPGGEPLEVIKIEKNGWVKISIDDGDIIAYVSPDYVDIEIEFEHAVTVEEEQEEARRIKEAEEALYQQQQAQQRQQNNSSNNPSPKPNNSPNNNSSNNSSSNSNSSNKPTAPSSNGTAKGNEIASFAKKFVGHPYVYGGTSLTNGADCSGFVQSVYKSFGYSIPRDSRSQSGGAGYKVSIDSVQAGDLIFYTNDSGRVNHVALYIGGGQVVHASNKREGIKISNYKYRTPYSARRVIN